MNSSSSPLLVIVAVFDHENGARTTLSDLISAQRNKTFTIKKAAILICQDSNILRFVDVYDMRPGAMAVVGSVIGGFIGLLDHTVIVPLAVGDEIDTLAAKLRDSGFTEDTLTHLKKSLKPGTSLIVAEMEPGGTGEVEWLLQQADATVSIHELRGNLVSSLGTCIEVKLLPGASKSGTDFPGTSVNS